MYEYNTKLIVFILRSTYIMFLRTIFTSLIILLSANLAYAGGKLSVYHWFEYMPQELLDEMYPPDILSDIQKTENQNYKQYLRKEVGGKLRHEVFFRDGYRCLECGRTNQDNVLHADHIKPVSKGGLTTLENLQTLCSICNHAKWAREWKAGERTKESEPELFDEDDT